MVEYKAIRRFVSKDSEAWTNIGLTAETVVRYSGTRRWATPYNKNVNRRTINALNQEAAFEEFEKQCDAILADHFRQIPEPIDSGTETDIEVTWQAIEKWFFSNTPPYLIWPLADGASHDSIAAAESKLGCEFPEDVRASYLRHDGSNSVRIFAFLGEGEWCSLDDVVTHWKSFHDFKDQFDPEGSRPALGPMKTMPWNDLWIPFTDDSSGNYLCIDLDPAEGGTRGQIFSYWHEYYGAWRFIAPSFSSMLEQLLAHLRAGRYAFREDGSLAPVDGPDPTEVDKALDFFEEKL